MKRMPFTFVLALIGFNAFSQTSSDRIATLPEYKGKEKAIFIGDTARFQIKKLGTVRPKEIKNIFPYKERDHELRDQKLPDSLLVSLKLLEDKKMAFEKKLSAGKPAMNSEAGELAKATEVFDIVTTGAGCPPDNTVAVSQSGFIIAADNSQIGFYNTDGTELSSFSWSSFLNPFQDGLGDNTSDPKVLYDFEHDRFVFFIQTTSDPDDSECILGFSESQDPQDGWNVYVFSSFRDDRDVWFDYPGLAYNEEEVFLTGNLFNDDDEFTGNVIYQIDKDDGYAGRSLDMLQWMDTHRDGWFAPLGASIYPVQTIPNRFFERDMVFVSAASQGGGDVYYYRIKGRMNSSPEMSKRALDVPDYKKPLSVAQNGTNQRLDGGDCRVKGGFYADNMLHFVFTKRNSDNFNGISYTRINLENFNVKTRFFDNNTNSEYCYPAVVHRASSASSRAALLVYLRSGPNNWPQIRMRKLKGNMSASGNSVTLQRSADFQSNCQGTINRWGDYICLQRRNNTSTFWIVGHTGDSLNRWRSHLIKLEL